MAAIRDLASTMPVTFVEIPAAVVEKIESDAYLAGVIPAGTYDGQDADVPTVAITNILVTHEKVSDEVAYQMTKLMFDNLAALGNAHSAARTSSWKTPPRTCRSCCTRAPSASTRKPGFSSNSAERRAEQALAPAPARL